MIQIHKPGFYSSIQDLGRFEYRDKGVPISGVMDMISAKFANKLIGNPEKAAVLEITMTGPELEFNEETLIAISGAIISPKLNGNDIYNDEVYHIKKGDMISFGKLKNGFRCYLAVQGGFKTETVLGSKSWYVSLTNYSHLQRGKTLEIAKRKEYKVKEHLPGMNHDFNNKELEVYKGPEFNLLSKDQVNQVLSGIFNVAKENSRMAYQLKQQLFPHKYSILTSSTLPGTVQFTPAGKLIILMKDAQTTGGYPRILQLTEEAIALLAQKRTDEEIIFSLKE
ncbi:biotin-dependent carboxyltransferase family protein [Galbibacter orientalis]|uniref:Allophanate hydrolase subunit 2 n=1 Tax=Galbibacter orientalis DSM 19592 TaxID=926559 RepID=I3CA01_9FLAO|nr:biotin-dependent carboxyltransferase family protein [Galbibacter orientalis]EIJ40444.1 allophanate hydrolase subunit 2 [Galbibacter orientalis DSM 19592]